MATVSQSSCKGTLIGDTLKLLHCMVAPVGVAATYRQRTVLYETCIAGQRNLDVYVIE